MTTRYFVDAQGRYLGATAALLRPGQPPVWPQPPEGGIEVPTPPSDAAQLWDAELERWTMPVPESARREIERAERENPITHRALREFFLGFGEVNPAFKATLLYQRVKAVDDAIQLERAKL